jgi:hypothetical protein
MHEMTREWQNGFLWSLIQGVVLSFVNKLYLWLKSDNKNRLFIWRPSCVCALWSYWVWNLQTTLVTVVTVVTLGKGKRWNSGRYVRIVTLCVHFLTCFKCCWIIDRSVHSKTNFIIDVNIRRKLSLIWGGVWRKHKNIWYQEVSS